MVRSANDQLNTLVDVDDVSQPRSDSTPAHVIGGRYEVLGLVGAGGMGTVYRVHDRVLDEIVALKMLRPDGDMLPAMIARFHQEVRLARKVTNHRVARIFDIGEQNGTYFLTMELVDGEPLSAHIARERRLGYARAVEIARAVCEGLAAAHAAGIVHRDLKPGNVILGSDGAIKIVDFGLAKAVADARTSTTMVGTPAYMAPEQLLSHDAIDPRADLYALGTMLYEMTVGVLPFNAPTGYAIAALRLSSNAPDPRKARPDMPDALAELVLACLAREPAERPADAMTVDAALSCITSLGAKSPRPPAIAPVSEGVHAKAVAVLPLKNLGPPEDAYIADGLTDDLIDRLSSARALRVRSRGVLDAAGLALSPEQVADPREIGRQLGVHVIVQGSVRRSAGRVVLSARLVSVEDGFLVWAQRFEGGTEDLLKLGDAAADAIASALLVERAATRAATLAESGVLELYLRGMRAYHEFSTEQALVAVRLLHEAVARAPDDPTILSGYALSLVRSVALANDVPDLPDDPLTVAKRAVDLAPMLVDTRVALATMLVHAGDHVRAAKELRTALELGPSNAEANALLGRFLVECGPLEDGIRRLELARALDPRLSIARADEARAQSLLGSPEKCDELLSGLASSDPGQAALWFLTRVRFARWCGTDMRLIETAISGTPLERAPHITALLRFMGGSALEDDFLEWMKRFASERHTSLRRKAFAAQLMAEVHALALRDEEALAYMESADRVQLIDLVWMDRCPLIARLRSSERFGSVRRSVALRAADVLGILGWDARETAT